MNNNIGSVTRQLYFPQSSTRLLVCSIASSVIHKPCPPSPNSFLKQRNVHPQIQRKGKICIRKYYTIHLVSPVYSSTINLPISKIASTSKEPPRDEDQAQNLRDQEIALVKLGELYRDQK